MTDDGGQRFRKILKGISRQLSFDSFYLPRKVWVELQSLLESFQSEGQKLLKNHGSRSAFYLHWDSFCELQMKLCGAAFHFVAQQYVKEQFKGGQRIILTIIDHETKITPEFEQKAAEVREEMTFLEGEIEQLNIVEQRQKLMTDIRQFSEELSSYYRSIFQASQLSREESKDRRLACQQHIDNAWKCLTDPSQHVEREGKYDPWKGDHFRVWNRLLKEDEQILESMFPRPGAKRIDEQRLSEVLAFLDSSSLNTAKSQSGNMVGGDKYVQYDHRKQKVARPIKPEANDEKENQEIYSEDEIQNQGDRDASNVPSMTVVDRQVKGIQDKEQLADRRKPEGEEAVTRGGQVPQGRIVRPYHQMSRNSESDQESYTDPGQRQTEDENLGKANRRDDASEEREEGDLQKYKTTTPFRARDRNIGDKEGQNYTETDNYSSLRDKKQSDAEEYDGRTGSSKAPDLGYDNQYDGQNQEWEENDLGTSDRKEYSGYERRQNDDIEEESHLETSDRKEYSGYERRQNDDIEEESHLETSDRKEYSGYERRQNDDIEEESHLETSDRKEYSGYERRRNDDIEEESHLETSDRREYSGYERRQNDDIEEESHLETSDRKEYSGYERRRNDDIEEESHLETSDRKEYSGYERRQNDDIEEESHLETSDRKEYSGYERRQNDDIEEESNAETDTTEVSLNRRVNRDHHYDEPTTDVSAETRYYERRSKRHSNRKDSEGSEGDSAQVRRGEVSDSREEYPNRKSEDDIEEEEEEEESFESGRLSGSDIRNRQNDRNEEGYVEKRVYEKDRTSLIEPLGNGSITRSRQLQNGKEFRREIHTDSNTRGETPEKRKRNMSQTAEVTEDPKSSDLASFGANSESRQSRRKTLQDIEKDPLFRVMSGSLPRTGLSAALDSRSGKDSSSKAQTVNSPWDIPIATQLGQRRAKDLTSLESGERQIVRHNPLNDNSIMTRSKAVQLEVENQRLQQTLFEQEQTIGRLSVDSDTLKQKNSSLERELKKMEERITELVITGAGLKEDNEKMIGGIRTRDQRLSELGLSNQALQRKNQELTNELAFRDERVTELELRSRTLERTNKTVGQDLREKIRKLEEAESRANELREQNTALQVKLQESEERIRELCLADDDFKGKIQELSNTLAAKEQQLSDLEEARSTLQNMNSTVNQRLIKEQQSLSELTTSTKTMQAANEDLVQRLALYERTIAALEGEKKSSQQMADDAREQIRDKQQRVVELETENSQLKRDKEDLVSQLSEVSKSCETKMRKLEEDLAAKDQELAEAAEKTQHISEIQDIRDTLERKIQELDQGREQQDKELALLRETRDGFQETIREQNEQLETLRSQKEALEREAEETRKEIALLNDVKTRWDEMQRKLDELKENARVSAEEIVQLKQDKETLEHGAQEVESNLKKAHGEVDELKQSNEDLNEQLRDKTAQLEELEKSSKNTESLLKEKIETLEMMYAESQRQRDGIEEVLIGERDQATGLYQTSQVELQLLHKDYDALSQELDATQENMSLIREESAAQQRENDELRVQVANQEETINELTMQVGNLGARLERTIAFFTASTEEVQSQTIHLQLLQQEFQQMKGDWVVSSAKVSELSKNSKELLKDNEKLRRDLSKGKGQIGTLLSQNRRLNQDITEKKQIVKDLERDVPQQKARLALLKTLQDDKVALTQKVRQFEKDKRERELQMQGMMIELDRVRSERQEHLQKIRDQQARIEELKRKKTAEEEENDELHEIVSLKLRQNELLRQLHDKSTNIQYLQETVEQQAQTIKSLKYSLKQLRNHADDLNRDLDERDNDTFES